MHKYQDSQSRHQCAYYGIIKAPWCQIRKEGLHYGDIHKAWKFVPAPVLLRIYPGRQTGDEVQDLDAQSRYDPEAGGERAKQADGPL